MTYRIGSLCSGYEGLGLAVMDVLGGELAWVADNDPGAAKILAYRFPSVPNLGDISETDWAEVEPVDVLTAGFPCQDISCAGKRAGLREGTRSGVWNYVARAIAALRPAVVVIENVRGLLTARGDEPTAEHLAAEAARDATVRLLAWLDNEHNFAIKRGDIRRARQCGARTARVMGLRKRAVARCQWHEQRLVRAIGTVLGSLADLGYDAQWVTVPASDAGAPHKRERVFILAWAAADPGDGLLAAQRGRVAVWSASGQRADAQDDRRSGDRGEAPADTECGELQRRGIRGVVGGAPGEPRQGHQREWSGHPAGDGGPATQDSHCPASGERRLAAPGQAPGGRPRADAGGPGGAPAADARSEGRERPGHAGSPGWPLAAGHAPTDATGDRRNEVGTGPDLNGRPVAAERGTASDTDGGGRGPGEHCLPKGECDPERRTPADPESHGQAWHVALAVNGGREARPGSGSSDRLAPSWGAYEPAIARWEAAIGRRVPRPTEPGRTGQRLSPRFVEFLMGLPAGWVTDVPGLTRNQQLHALGNGCVPQQVALALRLLLQIQQEAA